MAERSNATDSSLVDLAINQVLAAERDARSGVEDCRKEAELILDQAEERSRRIARRAEQRVKAAHKIADAAMKGTLQNLGEEGMPGMSTRTPETDEERLARAVEQLVEEIVGGSP